jgi:hypothetical protein
VKEALSTLGKLALTGAMLAPALAAIAVDWVLRRAGARREGR